MINENASQKKYTHFYESLRNFPGNIFISPVSQYHIDFEIF